MRKGKAAQYDRVDDRELSGRAADAQCEYEYGQETERFLLEQNAKPNPHILKK